MEGQVPWAGGSKQTAHGTKKLHDFHETKQPEQENKARPEPQRGDTRTQREREGHSPVRILSPRPPPHLPARLLARPTTAVGAADRGGQDQRCGACPFREVDPCSSLRRFIFRGEFFSWFSFLGERLGFFGREGGLGEVLGVVEAILLDRFKCGRPDDSASAGV